MSQEREPWEYVELPGEGIANGKGPEVGVCLSCLRNKEGTKVAEAEGETGRVVGVRAEESALSSWFVWCPL